MRVLITKNILWSTFMAGLGLILMSGCQGNSSDLTLMAIDTSEASGNRNTIETFSPNADSITRDFRTFWNYWNFNTNLAVDYTALDEKGKVIGHDLFLKTLKSGKYLPVLVKKDRSRSYYQLVSMQHVSDHNISETISYEAARYYKYCQMEGKTLPEYNFKDLDGHTYNTSNCKGKILVLNTWFVRCGACKDEMPDLNRLKKSYKNRNDIVFLGLCLDGVDSIQKFLTRVPFTYHIIANAKEYNQTSLDIGVYPTNIIVDKKGKVVKVMEGNFDALKVKLAKLANKD